MQQNKAIGYFRVGNKRKNSGTVRKAGEIQIDGDRANPILGNPYILHNPNDKTARQQVIESYRKDLEKDWAAKGPKYQECHRLAQEIIAGKKFLCMCWCHPKPCHLHLLAEKINNIVANQTGRPVENINLPPQKELF